MFLQFMFVCVCVDMCARVVSQNQRPDPSFFFLFLLLFSSKYSASLNEYAELGDEYLKTLEITFNP